MSSSSSSCFNPEFEFKSEFPFELLLKLEFALEVTFEVKFELISFFIDLSSRVALKRQGNYYRDVQKNIR